MTSVLRERLLVSTCDFQRPLSRKLPWAVVLPKPVQRIASLLQPAAFGCPGNAPTLKSEIPREAVLRGGSTMKKCVLVQWIVVLSSFSALARWAGVSIREAAATGR
jgi:hypothetical protein